MLHELWVVKSLPTKAPAWKQWANKLRPCILGWGANVVHASAGFRCRRPDPGKLPPYAGLLVRRLLDANFYAALVATLHASFLLWAMPRSQFGPGQSRPDQVRAIYLGTGVMNYHRDRLAGKEDAAQSHDG